MKYKTKANSPARDRLGAAITRRAEAVAEVAALQAAAAKLARATLAAAPIESEIARLDEIETKSVQDWCRGPDDAPTPAPDTEARSKLARELDAARSTAASASRAARAVDAEATAANQRLAEIESEISAAIALIIVDESAEIITAMRATLTDMNNARLKLAAAREFVLGTAETTRAPDVFRRLEHFDAALTDASGVQAPDLAAAYAASNGWREFAASLAADAGALRGTL